MRVRWPNDRGGVQPSRTTCWGMWHNLCHWPPAPGLEVCLARGPPVWKTRTYACTHARTHTHGLSAEEQTNIFLWSVSQSVQYLTTGQSFYPAVSLYDLPGYLPAFTHPETSPMISTKMCKFGMFSLQSPSSQLMIDRYISQPILSTDICVFLRVSASAVLNWDL